MTEDEIIRIVLRVVRQEMAPVLMALVNSNESELFSTLQRFATDSPLPNVRSIQPFGLSSKAPKGTPGLILPINGDPTNLTMVGHHDKTKPTVNNGETCLYDQFGHLVYLSATKMQFGSKASAENMVLGQVFKAFAAALLQDDADHDHIGNMGYNTSKPNNRSDFLDLKASPIEDDTILSDIAFTEKG